MWLGGSIFLLIAAVVVASFFIDEPLRQYMVRKLNSELQGYTVDIERLNFHPIGFSLDLERVTLVQNAIPDPPIAKIEKWSASLQWTALLSGRLVNNHTIVRPVLHITKTQAKEEVESEVTVKERGWQAAVESVYPFKINAVRINEGDITFVDPAKPSKPLRISHVNVDATNIRNVRSKDREYPSELHLTGEIFDKGHLRIDGNADFLAEPYIGVKGEFDLGKTPLEDLLTLTGQYNVQLRQGTLMADGQIEYGPHKKDVRISHLTLEGVHVDYVHAPQTKAVELKHAKTAYNAAKKVHQDAELVYHIDEAKLIDCELGYVNKTTKPEYRLFINQTNLILQKLSNQFADGPSHLHIRGRFMGTGDTQIKGTFRPEKTSPDFDMAVEIHPTTMKSLNDLWRAYGKFDVASGSFSFYSELTIQNGSIDGYVKPLFKDISVYNKRQDQHKPLLRQVYEGIVGGLATLLQNRPRDEVATKTEVSGPVENPHMNTVEVLLRLVENAFFRAILPGLDREVGLVTGK
jgi:hypothetical protein